MIESANNIFDILKTLLAIIPFLLLCFFSMKINLKKQFRDRQFLMPVFSLVFVIIVMIFLKDINNILLNLIKNIPIWIDSVLSLSWISQNVSDVLKQPVDALSDLMNDLNLEYWIFYITNSVVVLGYMIYKKVCISIMQKVNKKNRRLHDKIASVFYDYFAEKDVWCIKDSYIQARKFSRTAYYIVIILMSLIMLVSGRMYVSGVLANIFYPVFSVLLVGEIYYFLDGASRSEYLKEILCEDENAYKTVNYSLLRKYLRNLFGDKLMSENTNVNVSVANDITNDEVLDRLDSDEDPKVNTFATYYRSLNKAGYDLDHNYLNSSLDLLKGKSILFNNPFYKDLIPYAFYPMNRVLLSHKKVLIVLGRHSIENDIINWVENGVEAVTNIPFMWRIGILKNTKEDIDIDIGIITRSDVINIGIQNTYKDFLREVGFMIILEPSKLITTAQIGLNLLVKKCRKDEDKNIVFCLCDKNCDGLVDAMSHILMTTLTEVSATNKHKGTSSYMCWESGSDYIHHRQIPNVSRYLGIGTELSFAALKNQVSNVDWFGGEAFPVTDMNWIARQYYYELMKYAALPTNQKSMGEHFHTSSNFWSSEIKKNNFLTVEDESFNMYEILRDFSTRSTEQGFVNVISSDYLLKDYMADNNTIFETDAKAIPYLSADFARTSRNLVLGLLLSMSEGGVDEETIKKELSLAGLPVMNNTQKQLWYEIFKALSPVDVVTSLPSDYREAIRSVENRELSFGDGKRVYNSSIIQCEERFNFELGKMQVYFTINDDSLIENFVSKLKSASYISEDEKGEKYYLGSELCDHIYQKLLPGQFFTYSGKYYEMLYVTYDGQVLVRRASEHIDGRPSYRQLRKYVISNVRVSECIGAVKSVEGIELTHLYADFYVETNGYYKMDKYNDFQNARKIEFGGEGSRIPNRVYNNKSILKISLPNADGSITDSVRYTITVLLNEVFKTLFAENYPYIVALTDDSHVSKTSVRPLTYSMDTEVQELRNDSIYIVEDSNLDMGLLITVERNLDRIFQIIEDYLSWNEKAIELSLNPLEEEQPLKIDPDKVDFKEGNDMLDSFIKRFYKKITAPFRKVAEFIKKHLGKEKNKETITDKKFENADSPETVSDLPTTIPNKEEKNQLGFIRAPYYKRYYLLYGGESEPEALDVSSTLSYIKSLKLGYNPLREARNGTEISKFVEATFQPDKKNSRYCDFCGNEIFGVEYETLADGRDRCISCGRTAIKDEDEFVKIFEDVKRNLESFFGIRINTGIKVQMVNASKLNKSLGNSFVPTSGFDGRVLGVAINKNGRFTLMLENGSPRMMSMLTMAHELTHIWQYLNWDRKSISRKYGKLELQIYEGMAKWVEIQYAYLINEPLTAKREEIITSYRKDEYGFGYIRYKANYPLSTGTVITRETPFMNIETPLDPLYCGSDISILSARN